MVVMKVYKFLYGLIIIRENQNLFSNNKIVNFLLSNQDLNEFHEVSLDETKFSIFIYAFEFIMFLDHCRSLLCNCITRSPKQIV